MSLRFRFEKPLPRVLPLIDREAVFALKGGSIEDVLKKPS
jgi:hypothetical protein